MQEQKKKLWIHKNNKLLQWNTIYLQISGKLSFIVNI
jgi:hypothetical protein